MNIGKIPKYFTYLADFLFLRVRQKVRFFPEATLHDLSADLHLRRVRFLQGVLSLRPRAIFYCIYMDEILLIW